MVKIQPLHAFINRENEIIAILQKFIDAHLEFVLIGGYAVSAYKHRFSVDADIVIRREELRGFTDILEKNKFFKSISKYLDHPYAQFSRYEKRIESTLPVYIDLLINGIGIRQTGGFLSYQLLQENTEMRTISGVQKEITIRVPKREVLVALKLHAGRLTDLRDIASLTYNLDHHLLQQLITIGDTKRVKEHIDKLISLLDNKSFIDSFKGVFLEKQYTIRIEEIKKLATLKL